MDYTVELYKPYNNYVTDSAGNGHMEKAVKAKVVAIQWEIVVSIPVDDFDVVAVKVEVKKQLQAHLVRNTPDETYTVTI